MRAGGGTSGSNPHSEHCAVLYRQSRRRLPAAALVGAYSRRKAPRPWLSPTSILLLALLLASPIVARAAQAAEGTATAPRFEPAPCPKLPGAEELAKASCGYLVVPENRSRPNGRTIRLMVAKYPARSPEKRPDPVVYLAGGPGDIAPLEVNGLIAADFIRDRDIYGDEPARHHVLGAGADLRGCRRLRQRASRPPLLFRGNQARPFGGDGSLPPRTRRHRRRP